MTIRNDYKSPLIMERIYIAKSSFSRTSDSIDELELGVRVKRDLKILEKQHYQLELTILIGDENKKLEVSATCVAIFETETEQQVLVERNAVAIVFPYLRSYISTITTQPDMAPIVLPPMNIMAMLSDEKQ